MVVLGEIKHSSLLKAGSIGFLILVLLIPLAMTRGLIDDRIAVGEVAQADIQRAWGGSQVIAGPILVVPYSTVRVEPYGDRQVSGGELHFLPEQLDLDMTLVPEVRYRGVHEVPVYTAMTSIRGQFPAPDTSGLGIDDAVFDWSRAYFSLIVSDARAIRNAPVVRVAGSDFGFGPGGSHVDGFPPQVIAYADLSGDNIANGPITFHIDVDFAGTNAVSILPLGDTTSASMTSTWTAPSFSGNHLPETREINEQGFQASWRISSFGRRLPSRWTEQRVEEYALLHTAFGVELYQPVSLYQRTERATKYAVLIIGLTFVAYFLFEVLARLRLHPLQYLLIGLANTLFYLLLLSLAEHLGFGSAYLLSAVASTSMIVTYSASILGNKLRALMVGVVLACLYLFLYFTLNAEIYAMLAGSSGLWITLAAIMYLTRHIDWYGGGQDDNDQSQRGLFDRP